MSSIDFFDLDSFARGTPHEQFARLRREQPISWQSMPAPHQDQGFWLLTRHKDICEVARQPKLFISHEGSVLTDSLQIPHPAWQMVRDGLCHLDAPKHGELRRMAVPHFGPDALSALEVAIRQRAVATLERVTSLGEFDLVSDLATYFPVRVVFQDMLGFEEEDLPMAAYWGDLFNRVHAIPNGDHEFAPMMHASGVALDKLYQYGVNAYRSRREAPRNDLLSVLAGMSINDRPISEDEFLSYFWSMAIGAYDTTASTIAGGIVALEAHPEQRERLYDQPALIESAVEEMLRWETPVIYFRRTAVVDYMLNGQQIRKGDRVVMCWASGNRDEEAFEAPERFDIGREHNPHLSFGFGAHFCLGARLARTELRILFEEMVSRGIRFKPTAPAVRARSNFINRIVRMPAVAEITADMDVMAFD